MGIIVFNCLVGLLMLIAWFKILQKAGIAWWKILVPFYSIYVVMEKIYKMRWTKIFLMLIPIYSVYFGVVLINTLSKNFGKGKGFTVGLIFLPFIFYPILAFGNSKFIYQEENLAFYKGRKETGLKIWAAIFSIVTIVTVISIATLASSTPDFSDLGDYSEFDSSDLQRTDSYSNDSVTNIYDEYGVGKSSAQSFLESTKDPDFENTISFYQSGRVKSIGNFETGVDLEDTTYFSKIDEILYEIKNIEFRPEGYSPIEVFSLYLIAANLNTNKDDLNNPKYHSEIQRLQDEFVKEVNRINNLPYAP